MQLISKGFFRKHFSLIVLGLIIIFYLINGICYLKGQSITSDEGSFQDYAIRYLEGAPERIFPMTDNSKMPVSILNMIPRVAGDVVNGHKPKTDWGVSDIMHGRYITLLISVLIIVLVYKWAGQLYGVGAGLFSAFLMSVCPNSISNAALVTTDSYSVLFLLLSMYCLWKFCTLKTNRWFILLSVAVALSQLVKQSLFHLYLLLPLCMFVYSFISGDKFRWGVFGKRLLVFIIINLFIINAGYYFYQDFTAIGDYHFMSAFFQSVQQVFPSWLPVPFPKPFVDGLDMAKYYDQIGGGYDDVSSFGNVTILGHSKTGGGYWYYYFVSLFFKTPIAFLIFFAWGKLIMLRQRSFKDFIAKEFFLLMPVIYFIILMSFFYQTQCGIRHIIFIYPFLFILAGSIIPHLKNNYLKGSAIIISLFLLISMFRYWGNYFPYTNEFIMDKKMAYRYVGTGNLEFSQSKYFVNHYMEKHPEVKLAPTSPASGTFAINIENYLDIWNRHKYDWIKPYKPVGHIAYSYLLIEVPKSDSPRK